MKVNKAEVKSGDFRVWCEHCSIRIAPHEEKIAMDGKTYHQRCYSKHRAAFARGSQIVPAVNTFGDDK
jgi:hypothetical protein